MADSASKPSKVSRVSRPRGDVLASYIDAQAADAADVADASNRSERLPPWRARRPEDQIDEICTIFDDHCTILEQRASEERKRCQLKCLVSQDDVDGSAVASRECVHFERYGSDPYNGDGRLRAVRALLAQVDERGFERSNQQVRFHDAFIRACSRVFYREEWSIHKAAIMRHNGWATTPSEIMISTPRRFGKVRLAAGS